MYYFEELFFEGALIYGERQTLPLSGQGLIWLSGVNHDSKKGSNGSGKSTIVRVLQTILFRNATDNLMYGKKNYIVGVRFHTEKARYVIVQYRKLEESRLEELKKEFKVSVEEKLPSSGYLIFKNDRNITPHGIPACRKKIERIFVLTETEFLGTVYITPNRAHTLISGTAPERRRYFENVFSILSSYKRLQEIIGIKYDTVDERVKALTLIQGQLKTLESQLIEFKEESLLGDIVDSVNKKYEVLNKEKKTLDLEVKEIERKLYNRRKRKEILDQLNSLPIISEKEMRESELRIPTLKQEIKDVTLQTGVRRVYDAKCATLRALAKSLDGIDKKGKHETAHKEKIEKLSELQMKLKSKREFFADLKKLDHPQCPTCKQALDQSSIQKNLNSLRTDIEDLTIRIPKLEEQVIQLKNIISSLEKYNKTNEEILQLNAPKLTVEELNKKIEQIEGKLKADETRIEVFNKRSLIGDTLKNYIEEQLPKKEYYEKLKTRVSDLDVDLRIAMKEKTEYEYQLLHVKSLKQKISEANSQLQDFDRIKERLALLDSLYLAYGDRGLKLRQITNLCKLLVDRLGVYSNLMFQERNLVFSQNTEKDNFDIVAVRTYGGKKKTVDISDFSGGERKRLIPGLMLAQRDLLPNNKRTNLLIADELDANLDNIAKQAFVNNLLPVLKKKFETTIVIAHSEEMNSDIYDKRWQVVRKQGNSVVKFVK